MYPVLASIPSWVLPGANIDFDFEHGRYYQAAQSNNIIDTLLTVTRASQGWMDDGNGNWWSFANNVARRTDKGLLIEESRTNSIRNNSMQGGVSGTPGTAPTNWSLNGASSITFPRIVGIGTQNGIDYIDITISGTSSGINTANIQIESGLTIAASQNQVWGGSIFLSVVGGSTANLTDLYLAINETTNAGAFLVSDHVVSVLGSINSTLTRYSGTATLGQATTAFIFPSLNFQFNNAAVINLTIRIGWPQIELGSFITSPIRTTNATVTRQADAVTVNTVPIFGGAYTLFAKGTPIAPTAYTLNQNILQIDNGTDAQRLVLRRNASGGALLVSFVGGSGTNFSPTFTWNQSSSAKVAATATASDQAAVVNNGTIATGAGASLPTTPTEIVVGANATGGTEQWNGYIERITLWPTLRLSNAILQAITA